MCPSSGLWVGVLDPSSQFTILRSTIVRRAPALTLYERVFLSLSPHTCTLCPMFSLDPCVVGLAPSCTCWRKDKITQLCASHTCVTWPLVFFLTGIAIFISWAFSARSFLLQILYPRRCTTSLVGQSAGLFVPRSPILAKKNSKNLELKCTLKQIELLAKLLDYFFTK